MSKPAKEPRLIRFGTDDVPQPSQQAPVVTQPAAKNVVRTGPSGLLLGQGPAGPVSVRLFRTRPTRIMVSAPEYIPWLLAFRSISLGAHLSIVTRDSSRWDALVGVVRRCGGTADVINPRQPMPSQGRPYRPSLIVDDEDSFDGSSAQLGPWQAILVAENASTSGAVHALRTADMAIVSPVDSRAAENLRRAYALNQRQLRLMANLDASEVVLAMPRRVVRVSVPPTQTEYGLLFG